jgi:hypothetical protein
MNISQNEKHNNKYFIPAAFPLDEFNGGWPGGGAI